MRARGTILDEFAAVLGGGQGRVDLRQSKAHLTGSLQAYRHNREEESKEWCN